MQLCSWVPVQVPATPLPSSSLLMHCEKHWNKESDKSSWLHDGPALATVAVWEWNKVEKSLFLSLPVPNSKCHISVFKRRGDFLKEEFPVRFCVVYFVCFSVGLMRGTGTILRNEKDGVLILELAVPSFISVLWSHEH